MYKHGIGVREVPTRLPLSQENLGGVVIAFGVAPINMTDYPEDAVNSLFLCKSFDEAKEIFGYSEDYAKYSLCQVMDVFFKVAKTTPVILCNVLDPKIHSSDYTETLTIRNRHYLQRRVYSLMD